MPLIFWMIPALLKAAGGAAMAAGKGVLAGIGKGASAVGGQSGSLLNALGGAKAAPAAAPVTIVPLTIAPACGRALRVWRRRLT